jgi:hypothetical protein
MTYALAPGDITKSASGYNAAQVIMKMHDKYSGFSTTNARRSFTPLLPTII